MTRFKSDPAAPEEPGAVESLRLSLLGRFAASIGPERWKFTAPPKTLPLLAYLLLHRDAIVRRDRLSAILWPDNDEVEGKGHLRRHLYYLQRALPPAGFSPWLKADAQTVSWNPDAVFSLDISEFIAFSSSDATREQAAALYRGDLLEDIFAEEWLLPERERLRNVQFANLRSLILHHRIARNHALALRYAEQTIEMDPWREDAIRHLMSLRDETGDRAGALAEFARFRKLLQVEMGVDPMPETVALYETIRDHAGNLGTAARTTVNAPSLSAARSSAIPFVGRDTELEVLHGIWTAAARSHGSAVFVSGEAGIGKTRIARALAEIVSAEGGRALWGQTGSVEASPYQAMLDALRSALPLLESAKLDDVWLAAIAALLPELRLRRPAIPGLMKIAPEHEETRVFETFGRAFEAIAHSRPVLLVLEDLHWAGTASVALFEHLVRRITDRPILILGTYREEECGSNHPLRAFRRRALRERSIKSVALGPLSMPAIEKLVTLSPGVERRDAPTLAARLFSESGGNPLFLGELLRSHGEDPAGTDSTAGSIKRTIAARLDRLSTHAKSIAQFAAIIGIGFDLEVVVALAGWSEAEATGALDELIDRHIVRDAGSYTEDYVFSHQLIHSAIYETVTPEDLRRRHRRVAFVMRELNAERLDDIAAQLALHFDRGDEPEQASGCYLQASTRALSLFANDEASQYATRGLELTTAPQRRLNLLLVREEARRRLLDREGQRRDLDEAYELLRREPDTHTLSAVVNRRIALARARGERDAEKQGVQTLRELAAQSHEQRIMAEALIADSTLHMMLGDLAATTDMLHRALEILEQLSDSRRLIDAYVGLINCSFQQNNTSETARVLALATALATRTDDAQLRLVIAENSCKVALMTFDLPALRVSAEEMLRVALRIGDQEGVANAHMRLGMYNVRCFHVAAAREHLSHVMTFIDAHRDSRGTSNVVLYCNALLYLAYFNCELGRFDDALEFFRRAEEQQRVRGSLHGRCNVLNSRAYFKTLCGRSEDAYVDICAALSLLEEAPLVSRSVAYSNIGTVHRELGNLPEAIENLERGVQIIRETSPQDLFNLVGDLAELTLAYLRAGLHENARVAAAEFIGLLKGRTQGLSFPQRTLFIAAQAYRATGEPAAAQELLESAHAEMQRRLAEIPDEASKATFLAIRANQEILRAHGAERWPETAWHRSGEAEPAPLPLM